MRFDLINLFSVPELGKENTHFEHNIIIIHDILVLGIYLVLCSRKEKCCVVDNIENKIFGQILSFI